MLPLSRTLSLLFTLLLLPFFLGFFGACGSNEDPADDSSRALFFVPDRLPTAQIGEEYLEVISIQNTFTPVGEAYLQSGDLPPGLELSFHPSSETVVISGIPETSGDFTFTIGAWCYGTNTNGQSGSHEYHLKVE